MGRADDAARLCHDAAERAATETGVPTTVLLALALTESGRHGPQGWNPWPWAINEAGVGRWHPSVEDVLSQARDALHRGVQSFDLGCFQINYRWHGAAFPSLEAMVDPLTNARYAATFLARLHAELGDWTQAAGAYHSRTPALATRYSDRFAVHLAALVPDVAPPPTPAVVARANGYPLLQMQGQPVRGSVFAVHKRGAPLLPVARRALFGGG